MKTTKITLTIEMEHEEDISYSAIKESIYTGIKETFWTDEMEAINITFADENGIL